MKDTVFWGLVLSTIALLVWLIAASLISFFRWRHKCPHCGALAREGLVEITSQEKAYITSPDGVMSDISDVKPLVCVNGHVTLNGVLIAVIDKE